MFLCFSLIVLESSCPSFKMYLAHSFHPETLSFWICSTLSALARFIHEQTSYYFLTSILGNLKCRYKQKVENYSFPSEVYSYQYIPSCQGKRRLISSYIGQFIDTFLYRQLAVVPTHFRCYFAPTSRTGPKELRINPHIENIQFAIYNP